MADSGTEEAEAQSAGPAQVVKVRRELMVKCMTCPICHKLLRDATTISECLHTFCRKCIYEKLTDEEVDRCPVCNIHLGCLPVEKLRPDHNLQDLRAKIFPLRKTKVGVVDNIPSITLPIRRKEISLSSLVVSTPRVATQTSLTGRRTKAFGGRAATLHGPSPATNEFNKNEDDNFDKFAKKSSSTGNSSKPGRRQTSSSAELHGTILNKDTENGGKPFQDKTELWKPLNCLVEAANRTKSFKPSPQNSVNKAEQRNGPDSEVKINKTRVEEHTYKSKFQDKKNENIQMHPMKVKARRLKGVGQKRRNLANTAPTLFDTANDQNDKRTTPMWKTTPLWLSLVDQTGDSSLPQISTTYLRIKDGNVPVSYIQKYLVTKLNLVSETEVEITCRGEPVRPTMSLHNIVEQWLRGRASQSLQAVIGTTAQEFVVVLGYRRCGGST